MRTTLLGIIREPGFQRIAALVRTPISSSFWRRKHPHVPFWTLWNACERALKQRDKEAMLIALSDLLVPIAQSYDRMRYSDEDMDWLVQVLDSEDWIVTISMLIASATAPDTCYTPTELGRVTDLAEITWRKYAASGHILGSFKKGKQWLLPRGVLLSMQLITDAHVQELEGVSFEDDEEGEGHVDEQ